MRPDAAADVFGDAVGVAEAYVELLATRGVEWGLIGPRESGRLWERHVLNSVAIAREVPGSSRVVDVGSGAGLPGIPLALARPDVTVTLLEPLLRRASFLSEAVEELGLGPQVRVVRARAEEHRETYDVAVARAVAPLPRLVAWTRHLFWPRGRLVALKGARAVAELADARAELAAAGLRGRTREVVVASGTEPTWLVVVAATPA